MLPLIKIAVISTVVTIVLVGATIGIIYAVAPLQVADNGSCRDIQGVTELQFVSIGDSLTLTWTTPVSSGRCSLTYDISIYINDVLAEEHTVTNTNYVVNSAVNSCSVVRADIKATSDTDQQGSLVSQTFNSDIGEITDVIITDDLATWTGSSLEGCSFLVEINDGSVQDRQDNTYYDISGYSEPCKSYKISVTPIHYNGTTGDTINELFETDLEEVSGFRLTEDEYGNIVAHWTHLSENCKIRVTVGPGDNSYTYPDVPSASQIMVSSDFIYCIANEVTVQFVSDSDKTGKLTQLQYERETGKIDNFTITDGDDITATWNYIGYEACSVTIKIDDVGFEQTYTDLTVGHVILDVVSFEYCETYPVTAYYSYTVESKIVEGEITDIDFEKPLARPEGFEIEETDDNQLIIKWNDVPAYENCGIQLTKNSEPVIFKDVEQKNELIVTDIFEYCVEHNVTISFRNPSGTTGLESASQTHSRELVKPEKFEIQPGIDTAHLSWTNFKLYEDCDVEIEAHGKPIYVPEQLVEPVEITLSDLTLEYCAEYDVNVKITNPLDGEFTSDTTSSKRHPQAPFIDDIKSNSDTFTIFWDYNGYEQCALSVKVDTETVATIDPGSTTEISTTYLTNCKIHDVQLMASLKDNSGTILSNEMTVTKEIPNPKIERITPETDKIVIDWNYEEYTSCDKVIVIDTKKITLAETDSPDEIDPSELENCVNHNIHIEVTAKDGTGPVPSNIEITTKLTPNPIIQAIIPQTDKIVIDWNFAEYTSCDKVIVIDTKQITLAETDSPDEIDPSELENCVNHNIHIEVTAKDGTGPVPSNTETTTKLTPNPIIQTIIPQTDKIVIDWNFAEYTSCDKVIVIDTKKITLAETDSPDEIDPNELENCVNHNIHIEVTAKDGTGPVPSNIETTTKLFLPIKDLRADLKDSVVTLFWTEDLWGKCEFSSKLSVECTSDTQTGSESNIEINLDSGYGFEECRVSAEDGSFTMSIKPDIADASVSVEVAQIHCSYRGTNTELNIDTSSTKNYCPDNIMERKESNED